MYWYSDGEKLVETTDCIPSTQKEQERKTLLVNSGIGSTGGVERVLLEEAILGSRNNSALKWAMFLKDEGFDFEDAKSKVLDFNSKLPEPLPKRELESSVLKSLERKYDQN